MSKEAQGAIPQPNLRGPNAAAEFGDFSIVIQKKLLGIAKGAGSNNPEDVVQDALLSVWQNREKIRSDCNLPAYIARSVINGTRDEQRSSNTVRRVFGERDLFDHTEDVIDKGDAPEAQTLLLDLARKLQANMSEEFFEAMFLSAYLDLSPGEIAKILGIPEITARTRAFKGRKAARAILEGSDS